MEVNVKRLSVGEGEKEKNQPIATLIMKPVPQSIHES